MVATFD